MIVRPDDVANKLGYNAIAKEEDLNREMLMDFGLLRLTSGDAYDSEPHKERAFLLLDGRVLITWRHPKSEGTITLERWNLLDEEPTVVHVSHKTQVSVSCQSPNAELAVQARINQTDFDPSIRRPGEYPLERFGEGTLQNTSTRIVRTFFDAATAPASNMVLGEVVNYPGKWSSYPPHTHPQPEIYHYRFFPEQGFGFSEHGENVFKVRTRDTALISPYVTHPQTAAPGYAMYYIWAIPHLPGNRFGPDSRIFCNEHKWVMQEDAPIWPDASLRDVVEHQYIVQQDRRQGQDRSAVGTSSPGG